MHFCDDYSLVFDGIHDLLRQVKHPEKDKDRSLASTKRWMESEPLTNDSVNSEPALKKRKVDKESEMLYFMPIRKTAGKLWLADIKQGKKQYIDDGYSKATAQAKSVNDNIRAI